MTNSRGQKTPPGEADTTLSSRSAPVDRRPGPAKPAQPGFGGILAAALIVASFISSVPPVGAAVALGSAGIVAVRVGLLGRLEQFGWATLAFLGWTALLGAAVGASPSPGELTQFLGFEGRPFVSYAPLLALATMRTTMGDLARVRAVMQMAVVVGGALYLAGVVGLHAGIGVRNFHGLTSSHHASGMLFATCALVLLVWGRSGSIVDRATGIASIGLTVATGSRTSLIGLLFAGLYLTISTRDLSRRVRTIAVIAACVVLALILSGRVSSTVASLGSSQFTSAAIDEFSEGDTADTGKVLGSHAPNRGTLNVLKRVGVWRGGIDEFVRSPIVGIGSWRLNDTNRSYTGVPGLIYLAHDAESVHSQGFGAHNALIQIAAETGVIGLLLFAGLWWALLRRIRRSSAPPAVRRAGLALVAFALGTALSSNGLVSPALCFPVFAFAVPVARHAMPGTAKASSRTLSVTASSTH